MKHQTTTSSEITTGDTRDLVACLRLTHMPAATRSGTIGSVRALASATEGGTDVAVERLAEAVARAKPTLKAALGPR